MNETLIIVLVLGIVLLIVMIWGIIYGNRKNNDLRDKYYNSYQPIRKKYDEELICPHCQSKGTVSTQSVEKTQGVSGGKLAAAILTLGWSILFVGLSRKEIFTQARCNKCGSVWHFN